MGSNPIGVTSSSRPAACLARFEDLSFFGRYAIRKLATGISSAACAPALCVPAMSE